MKLDCEIVQCFAMSGAYESCEASINLVSEKITLVSKHDFGNSKELQKYMGAEYFEIHISYDNEMQVFNLDKISDELSFKITNEDMNIFKNFKSALLFHEKLDTALVCKKIKKDVLKI
jgi:hypothetical protein